MGTPAVAAATDIIAQLTPTMPFDALAIQIDETQAWDEQLSLDVHLTCPGCACPTACSFAARPRGRHARDDGCCTSLAGRVPA
ncbi:alkyl sulfatase C-terminal domain-containing protein [Streptomyces sp. NPDC015139]|uniref:alkyl sulfatase C-terminal domain-containing protein n=1 Tax=Streptomyces sp. NPDC015139 TaxID=3364942 RepID=UPI0036FE45D3